MKGSEPWPQNSKYFQQKLKKIYCNILYFFKKFFKKQKGQEGQFYFQNFIDIGQFIILADTTTKTATRNKRTRYFARKGVTMASQKKKIMEETDLPNKLTTRLKQLYKLQIRCPLLIESFLHLTMFLLEAISLLSNLFTFAMESRISCIKL